MTAVDQTIAGPTPALPHGRRSLTRMLARPGWVIMTLLSLITIAFVARYLAFNPDTYFPEQREVYIRREFVLGVHVLLRHACPGGWPLTIRGQDQAPVPPPTPLLRRDLYRKLHRLRTVGFGPCNNLLRRLDNITRVRVAGLEHVVHDLDRAAHGVGSPYR
jgi:hypothetical protein